MKPALVDTDILSMFFRGKRDGTPVDDIDLLIAGTAVANNLVLITHNQRHFSRIEGLEWQDWSQS